MNSRSNSIDNLLHELYATAVRAPESVELWEELVNGLARRLDLPFVLLGRYGEHGTISVEASSRTSHLWSDLQRVPERWDDSVVGHGLAALVLHADDGFATLATDDDRFACWREGAQRDGVVRGAALLIDGHLGKFVIEMFARTADALESPAARATFANLRTQLKRLFNDISTLREQRLLAGAIDQAGNAAFITDREGIIVWCNQAFLKLYGYRMEEVVGQNPRFLKSGKQGMRYYKDLWNTIRAGKFWSGETVDHDRNGRAYTVRQTVSPFSVSDRHAYFLALHDDISSENAQRQRHERRLGTDPVTGLLTRAAFEVQLSNETEDSAPWDLLLVSLREFHQGLVSMGADLTDAVSAQLGARIRETLGEDGIAGVLAPGDFGIQTRLTGAESEALTQSLEQALARPFPQLDPTLIARPRVATSHYPADGKDFVQLVNHADRQLANQPAARAHR